VERPKLFLFGAPQLERGGTRVAIERRKALALLAYLATMPGAHARDTLAALLWPEADATQARAHLSRVLVDLRQAAGPQALDADVDRVALRPDELFVDVIRFRTCVAQVAAHHPARDPLCDACLAALAEAVDFYRGDFLSGFTLRDAPDFDTWQTYTGETLRLELGEALESLALAYNGRDAFERALPHARRWLALDPLCEPAHRCLMRLYAGLGDRAAAFAQYEACTKALQSELGIPPEPETTALYEQIKAGILRPRGTDTTTAAATRFRVETVSTVNNLPAPADAFFGRETELVQIAERLADPACRLLTILGPGGVGKTRLAVEAGRAEVGRFHHGICFVPLAAVDTPDLVAAAILQTLAASKKVATTPQQQVADFLAERQLLLILDNYEHLLANDAEAADDDGVGLLPRLLEHAPGLKLLVTSRERLNLHDEWLLPLGGLDLPPDDAPAAPPGPAILDAEPDASGPLDLGAHAATRFFLHCARRVQPGFSPSPEDARLIARICRQVDGVPLAIELVAPWLRALPLPEITRRLVENLDLLAANLRDVPARHRSMRAAFDQSWRLLTAHERTILRCCSIFRDGFTAEAAQAIANASLADLSALVDRSWVTLLPSGRYDLHTLIRHYCAERLSAEHLAETGETPDAVRDRHGTYFVGQLDQWEQACRAAGHRSIANQPIAADLANVEDAWHRMVDPCDPGQTYLFWALVALMDACFSDSVTFQRLVLPTIDRVRELCRPADTPVCRPDALVFLAGLQYLASCLPPWSLEQNHALLDEALSILDRVDPDTPGWQDRYSDIRSGKAGLYAWWGERTAGIQLIRELLASLPDSEGKAWPYRSESGLSMRRGSYLTRLGLYLLHEGEYAEARAILESTLEWLKGWWKSLAESVMAEIFWSQGEYERGKLHALEAARAARDERDPQRLSAALMELGRIETRLGGFAEARAHFMQSAAACRPIHYEEGIAAALAGLGQVELSLGRPARAQEFFAEAWRVCEHWARGRDAYSAIALLGLGQAAAAQQDSTQAMDCYRRALRVPARMGRTTMEAIASAASVVAMDGDPVHAAELLAFVVAHRYTTHWVKEAARKLLVELEAELPAELFAAATARGRARELPDVEAEIRGDGASASHAA